MLQAAGVAAAQQAHSRHTTCTREVQETQERGGQHKGIKGRDALIEAVRAPPLAAGLGLHGESEAMTVAASSPEEEGREEEKSEE